MSSSQSSGAQSSLSGVPDWLNSEFVEKHLRNHYTNDGIKVIDFVVRCTSGDLGNFASKIYRANVTFSSPPKCGPAVKDEVG